MFSWLWTCSQIKETCLLKFKLLIVDIPFQEVKWVLGGKIEVVISRPQNHGMALLSVCALMIMQFSVQHAPAICNSCCIHKSRLTGLQSHAVFNCLAVICIHVKFHLLNLVKRSLKRMVKNIGPSTLPCGRHLLTACQLKYTSNFNPLQPPAQVVIK